MLSFSFGAGVVKPIKAAGDHLFANRPAHAKYADLVVGQPGLLPLLRHEAVLVCSQWVPGAPGLALRRVLYPRLLGSCGRNVVFGQNVTLRHPHKIHVGDNAVIDDNCLLDAKGEDNAGILIGANVFIGRNTILSCKNGDIVVEDRVNIGFNCEIFSGSEVRVGADTMLAAYCYLIGGDHASAERHRAISLQQRVSRGIVIGSGGWLGAGVKVLDGVCIGDRAIVGAGAVVRRNVPDGATAVGIPARILGSPVSSSSSAVRRTS